MSSFDRFCGSVCGAGSTHRLDTNPSNLLTPVARQPQVPNLKPSSQYGVARS
jgi:hypothetical protein